jgi:hypothetical protein
MSDVEDCALPALEKWFRETYLSLYPKDARPTKADWKVVADYIRTKLTRSSPTTTG